MTALPTSWNRDPFFADAPSDAAFTVFLAMASPDIMSADERRLYLFHCHLIHMTSKRRTLGLEANGRKQG